MNNAPHFRSTEPQTPPVDAPATRTLWVTERSRALGFDLCGVAPADAFAELANLPEWLARGYAGEMKYLHDSRRGAPSLVLDGVRSVIVCALKYNTSLPYSTEAPPQSTGPENGNGPSGWISRYAWGDDYHLLIGEKLEALAAAMREKFAGEPFTARAYVDTGPIVERVAAKYAGLGWLAKNTCLINEDLGSWLFLGVILTTLELAPSLAPSEAPPPDLCGNCRVCIDACPTEAIVAPYVLDARRCISYLTIELRGSIPEEFRSAMGRMVFGCDICQDVCPWNRNASRTQLANFLPRTFEGKNEFRFSSFEFREGTEPAHAAGSESLFQPHLELLASLTEEQFRKMFRGSAIKRTKWRGLVRNACVALGNSGVSPQSPGYPRLANLLDRLASSNDSLIAEHARWALARLSAASSNGRPNVL